MFADKKNIYIFASMKCEGNIFKKKTTLISVAFDF